MAPPAQTLVPATEAARLPTFGMIGLGKGQIAILNLVPGSLNVAVEGPARTPCKRAVRAAWPRNAGDDASPVATTRHFLNIREDNGARGTGTHTFYFLARKFDELMADGRAEDASLSVICVNIL